MRKCFGYIRVSSTKQIEGVSLSKQKREIKRYCAENNIQIIKWYDETYTAAKAGGRAIFNEIIKKLKNKEADGVVFYKIDRGARNLTDWDQLKQLVDQGIEIHFAYDQLDLKTRAGRLVADIQAVVAADEIQVKKERALSGLYGRLEDGIYPFRAPTGYIDKGKGKVKAVDPIQAQLVRQAFELYSTEKYTLKTLLQVVRTLGLTTATGTPVALNTLSIILNNSFYIGLMRVKDRSFTGKHDSIISTQLFKKVQSVLNGRSFKSKKHDYLFRKTFTCALCNYTLIGETQKGHVYYRCHTKTCPTKGFRSSAIELLLKKTFRQAELLPSERKRILTIIEEEQEQYIEKLKMLKRSTELQISQSEAKLDTLTDAYLEGIIDKGTLERKKNQILLRISELKEKTSEFSVLNEDNYRGINKFLELATSLIQSYENANPDKKSRLVKIVTSNHLAEGKKLSISIRSPFFNRSKAENLTKCAHLRDEPHIIHTDCVDFSKDSVLGKRKPLSDSQLRKLLDRIIEHLDELSDIEFDL